MAELRDLGVTRQQIASANVQSTVGAEVLEQARGARKGDATTLVPKQSDLSDIMEEIGNAVGKFADKRTLGQAKIRQGAGANIEALKRIADYYDKLPDMPKEASLRALVGTLQKFEDLLDKEGGAGGSLVSSDDVLRALRDFDGDVTHQYEALQIARQYFEETGASQGLLAVLDRTQAVFEDPDIARDVQAGYAIAQRASEAAPTLETDPAALRDRYREMLRGPMHMGQLFDALADFNLRLNFDTVVGVFLETAGDDLAATSHQTDPVLLGGLTQELGKLKEMRTVYQASDDLIHTIQRMDPQFASPQIVDGPNANGPEVLTSALLNFCAKKTPNLSDARQVIKPYDDSAVDTIVVFANGLHDLHKMISDRSYPSNEARLQQGSMLEALRIDLTAIEEQAYEADNAQA